MITLLYITRKEDWYFVTNETLKEHGGYGLISSRYRCSLIQGRKLFRFLLIVALGAIYPEHDWKFYHFYKPHQRPRGVQGPVSKGQCIKEVRFMLT